MKLNLHLRSIGRLDPQERNSILALALILILSSGVIIHYSLEARREADLLEAQALISAPKLSAFTRISLSADAAFVWDIKNKRALYSLDSDRELPLASLTKIMTAVVATDILEPDTKITIQPQFLEADGDSGLVVNEIWFVKDLIDFSLLVSSNDGARAIAAVAGAKVLGTNVYGPEAETTFVKRMNSKALQLGMVDTRFYNESGLDKDKQTEGAYGSARDIAKLLEYAILTKPDVLSATRYANLSLRTLNNHSHEVKNTNTLVGQMAGVLASKTGFTDIAGGNLAVVFDPEIGRPIVVVVLGSTQEERMEDVNKLIQASIKEIGLE